uniref:BRICHOS domain-containing protein n=1 Tax=Steinernema glaseri TaxID=37863 RepID=A0A1I8AUI0_9BILA
MDSKLALPVENSENSKNRTIAHKSGDPIKPSAAVRDADGRAPISCLRRGPVAHFAHLRVHLFQIDKPPRMDRQVTSPAQAEPVRQIEQIEVIEHHITESYRPIGAEEVRQFRPYTSYRTSSESQVQHGGAVGVEFDDRYDLTGERNRSLDASYLQSSGMSTSGLPPPPPPPQVGAAVNSYGYDVHEVHTAEGGARIVQTHGAGQVDSSSIMQDRSFQERSAQESALTQSTSYTQDRSFLERSVVDTTPPRPGVSSALRSGAKEVGFLGTAGALRESDVDGSPLSRKESYRQMQRSQEIEGAGVYAPRSEASLVTAGSSGQGDKSWTFMQTNTQTKTQKGTTRGLGCWDRTVLFWHKLQDRFRNTERTPAFWCTLLLILLFLLLLLFILYLIISSIFTASGVQSLLLYPPVCEECAKKNPMALSSQAPSRLYTHWFSPSQVHLELVGNPPFKSNSFTAIDFDTGYIAYADHALTDDKGRHYTCFLMSLDRSALPSMSVLRDGVRSSEVHSQFGWQEYWQYVAEPIEPAQLAGKFTEPIKDCENAKWYFLKHTVYTR